MLPIESSLVGPIAETHDLLYGSALSIIREATLPIRHCVLGAAGRARRGGDDVLVAPGGVRPVPRAPRRARRAAASRPRPPPTPRADGGRGRGPEPARDRECRGGRRLRARGARRRRRRQAGRVHALRRTRAVHAARKRRRLAHGALVRHRPSAGCALPRARAARAQRRQPGAARLAAAPELAVALPFRRRARRPRLRSRRCGPPSPSCASLTRELRLFGSYSAEVAR